MEQKKAKSRIAYIDLAKGITIYLVIVGHAANNLDEPFYRLVLYAFHMPLFFMLSGMLMRPKEKYGLREWKDIIFKNLKVLIVPYFLWGIIYAPFTYVNIGRIGFGSWRTLTNAGTLTSLWYIPCLFLIRMEMHLLFMLFKKIKANSKILAAIAAAVSFAIGFVIPYNGKIGYFWCVDISFVGLGFVLVGYVVKELLDKFSTAKARYHVVGMIMSAIGLFAGTYCMKDNLTLVLMCDNTYGNLILFFWNSIWGSMMVLCLAMLMGKCIETNWLVKKILYIGQNTFAIYLLHKPILQKLIMIPLGWIGLNAWNFWVVAVASLVALLLSCVFNRIIERYLPQLLGKFPVPDVKIVESAEETVKEG